MKSFEITQCPLVGTWKLDHAENYDCYLKELGKYV